MPFADETTIILGADGFVGRHLVDRWRANGWPVSASDCAILPSRPH